MGDLGQLGNSETAGVNVKSWAVRLVVLCALLAVYVVLWRPFRTFLTIQSMQPLSVSQTELFSDGISFAVKTGPYTALYKTIGGSFWLFPGIVFVLMGLWKPVVKLWLGHLAAGVLIFICFWIGVHGAAGWMIKTGGFLISYAVPAGSIGYLVLELLTEKNRIDFLKSAQRTGAD